MRLREQVAVDTFEALLRGTPGPLGLQDMLAESVKWAEGMQATPATLQQVKQAISRTLLHFLQENRPLRLSSTPLRQLVDEVVVTVGAEGKVDITLPAEVRQWLIPPSMISF